MTDLLLGSFPWLVALAVLVVAVLWFQLDRRLGRGASSPGPAETVLGNPPGLERTPWELRSIDHSLRSAPGSQSRNQLILTLNRLLESGNEPFRLHFGDGNDQVELAVAILERRLDLATPGPTPGPPPGSIPSGPS